MKRKWTNESANNYVKRVEQGKEPMGLKYLSAKDYITNHARLSSMCKYSIINL